MNVHSAVDLNGACGLWDSVRAELYSLVGERRHPPHTVHLCKQVDAGRGVVLEEAKRKRGVKIFGKENCCLQLQDTYCIFFYIFKSKQ